MYRNSIIDKARQEAEEEIGFEVPDKLAKEVLAYCIKKLHVIGKDVDYLPILYRYELPMKVAIMCVNNRPIFE